MIKRREFIEKQLKLGLGFAFFAIPTKGPGFDLINEKSKNLFFKLSLAQWSLHKGIDSGKFDPYDFAKTAKELGFSGLEYVNQLYSDVMDSRNKYQAIKNFIKKNNDEAQQNNVENLLIMIDGEGDLATSKVRKRNAAVENHKKWIDAASQMGCHSVRVNLYGSEQKMKWMEYSSDSLSRLSEFSKDFNINVIVENHGSLSSNAELLMQVINNVNLKNCGTLPDFGNFCIKRVEGDLYESDCVKEYDRYKGIKEMMPKAFAVSAKSNSFNYEGDEIYTDYLKMLKIVKESGYNGYIGVEYEGTGLSEIDGILATKNLLINKGKLIS
ncbi:sugar phosphate isomerase/epimerase [Bacteroidota bacterium]|nr:sugar phosphate isomerase/epimerase [Bacteroidota bacterium]